MVFRKSQQQAEHYQEMWRLAETRHIRNKLENLEKFTTKHTIKEITNHLLKILCKNTQTVLVFS